MAVRERKMLRSRWKRRVELNNGTSIEDAEKKEKTGEMWVESYVVYDVKLHPNPKLMRWDIDTPKII